MTGWIVRGEAEPGAPEYAMGIEPARDDKPGGWPYLIREDRTFEPGETPLHIAHGIQDINDAHMLAAAPTLHRALTDLVWFVDAEMRGDRTVAERRDEIMARARAALLRAAGKAP